ncbi:MAG: hypothetical protein EHM70_19640 [Chloroflexota bacterium]|nr:MAG: hypothetical protein EHM70_19640 [Chloroflexota bacterium]
MTISNTFQNLVDWLRGLFSEPAPRPGGATGSITPVNRKVSLIILDPIMHSEGGRRMTKVMGWNDPDRLAADLIADLRTASYGYANFEIVERILVDEFPPLEDGFAYTSDEFMRCWRSRQGFHNPVWVDYHRFVRDHNIISKVRSGAIDEVWTVGFPYAGFYESRMGGPGPFWCNAPPLENTSEASRRFIVMAFNFERGVGEMLESHGHRAESIMNHVYRSLTGERNLWKRFSRYDKTNPGQAEIGSVHYAPNSQTDYDWGNPTKVTCRSRAWMNFPDLSAEPAVVDCAEWGNGDIRLHHLWWFMHMPHIPGATYGISNNWWEYIIDPNKVR